MSYTVKDRILLEGYTAQFELRGNAIQSGLFIRFLKESFERINKEYFFNLIEMPNLKFNNSINKLGSYEYGSDTITISKHLANESQEIMDYVMYHEMLHKKHKFKNKNNRNYHHTKTFRQQEKQFKNSKDIEKQLSKIVSKNKIKKRFKLL